MSSVRACSLTCFLVSLCLLSFQALVGFASRGHCLFSRSFLAGIASFFPILQLLFRRFFFDRFLLNPGFLPLRTLYSLVPGLGFSKFVARLECRDFSCDLGGSASLPFESDSEGLVFLPGTLVPHESWISYDLYVLPGSLRD